MFPRAQSGRPVPGTPSFAEPWRDCYRSTTSPSPEATLPRLRASAVTVANRIGSAAVLEYGPTEILPLLAAMLPAPARLCRPRRPARPLTPAETARFST
jgi:hypothetical protein